MSTFAGRGRRVSGLIASTTLAMIAAGCETSGVGLFAAAPPPDPRAVHERLLTLDTHLDTPALLIQPGWRIDVRHDPAQDYSQVDQPRMEEGGLDGGFWVIYTQPGELTAEAYERVGRSAMGRARAIRNMVDGHDAFELALRAEDAERIAADGRRVVYMSIENSYPLGEDISLLEAYYDLGVRMVGPVHFAHNQFASSATDDSEYEWGALSPLGEELVREANRLGIVLDASHASDTAFDAMIALSETPLILSHSGARALFDHPRNIDDERLRALAANGGVIQMNSVASYLIPTEPAPERSEAVQAVTQRFRAIEEPTEADYQAYLAERRAIDEAYPPQRATFEDFMEQMLHVLALIGPDHVGVGADWDGGGGVIGMEDVSDLPRITERLLEEGYSEGDIEKIWSGNVLRVLRAAEDHAASLESDDS